MAPLSKNVAPLIFEDEEGHRRPIGFVEVEQDLTVTGRFNIISRAHLNLAPSIKTALRQSRLKDY